MKLLDIITYGHPTLRMKAADYHRDEINHNFIDDLLNTMYEKDGIGLAAPQVDVSRQVLAATDLQNEYILINPKIIAHSESSTVDIEGCLSIPGFQANVSRYDKIVVKAQDPEGKNFEITTRGLLARVLQHEIDHLNGILYIDRAEPGSVVRLTDDPNNEGTIHKPVLLKELQSHFKERYHSERQTDFQRRTPLEIV
ncbi:peptide deformylase [candidate division KSB1 bacterium]|nr:peptide deformylase [candidate division KSB1 bacterium]